MLTVGFINTNADQTQYCRVAGCKYFLLTVGFMVVPTSVLNRSSASVLNRYSSRSDTYPKVNHLEG